MIYGNRHVPDFEEYKNDVIEAFANDIDDGEFDQYKNDDELYDALSEHAWNVFDWVAVHNSDVWKYELAISHALWEPEVQAYIGADQYTIPNNPMDARQLIGRIAFEYVDDVILEMIEYRRNRQKCPECDSEMTYWAQGNVYECPECHEEIEDWRI